MRLGSLVFGLAACLAAVAPARADAPPDARHVVAAPAGPRLVTPPPAYRYAARRRHHRVYGAAADFGPVGPPLGPEPRYFGGYGGASPSGGAGDALVTVTEYREAYIGRGLFYNTPPQPFFPVGYAGRSNTISVRY